MTPDRPTMNGRPPGKTALREPDATPGGDFSWPPPADDPSACSIVMLEPDAARGARPAAARPAATAAAEQVETFHHIDLDIDTALDAFADPPPTPMAAPQATRGVAPCAMPVVRPSPRWHAAGLRSIVAVGIGASLALMPPPGAARLAELPPGVVPAQPAAQSEVAPRRARTPDRLRPIARFVPPAKRPDVTLRDEDRIRTTLADLRAAYAQLDADAARRVWPSVDAAALARAFDGLHSQELRFDRCDVTVRGARARAACTGEAIYVPRVGDPAASTSAWTFELTRRRERWTITSARAS